MPISSFNIFNYKNSILGLSFFVLVVFFPFTSKAVGKDSVENKLTAARVVVVKSKYYTEVTFNESQRFYKLLRKNKSYTKYLKLLKWSEKNKIPVVIMRRSEYSDTILSVKVSPISK